MSIFLSYSRANSDFANKLAKDLINTGHNIWFDQLSIPTGTRWDDEIEKALHNCSTFLIVLSPEAMNSQNVKDEIGYAIDKNKRILPVLLEPCEIPLRLRRVQYVNFTEKPYDQCLIEIKDMLVNTGKLQRPNDAGSNAIVTDIKPSVGLDQVPQTKANVETRTQESINSWIQIWWARGLLFMFIGVILSIIAGDPSITLGLGIVLGVLGIVFYHHKVSYTLWGITFIVGVVWAGIEWGGFFNLSSDDFAFSFIAGISLSAIVSRVLHVVKAI